MGIFPMYYPLGRNGLQLQMFASSSDFLVACSDSIKL